MEPTPLCAPRGGPLPPQVGANPQVLSVGAPRALVACPRALRGRPALESPPPKKSLRASSREGPPSLWGETSLPWKRDMSGRLFWATLFFLTIWGGPFSQTPKFFLSFPPRIFIEGGINPFSRGFRGHFQPRKKKGELPSPKGFGGF